MSYHLLASFLLLLILYKPKNLLAHQVVEGKVVSRTTDKFKWSQSVDSVTGIASSLETSSLTIVYIFSKT